MPSPIRTLAPLLAIVAASFCGGCGPSFTAATPPGFVELDEDSNYDYRATSANGVVLGIREIDHEPKGEVEFWTRAIENRLRHRGGYALLETKDVKNVEGIAGKRMLFGHDENGTPHLYSVTLFVTDDKLFVLEAGGSKDLMQRREKQIDWAVRNFRTD